MSKSMIYYLDGVQAIRETDLRELLPFLSQQRRETMSRYRFPKDRVQSALAYLLLRYGLICDYGINQVPGISKTEHGKPYLTDNTGINFNLSHCEAAVACGFSRKPLGIDIQQLVPYKTSLAKFFMTPSERIQTLSGNPDQEFTRLWTVKESYGKYLGSGICYSMSEVPLRDGPSFEGYIIRSYSLDNVFLSVCAEEEIPVKKVCFHELRACFLKPDGSYTERNQI